MGLFRHCVVQLASYDVWITTLPPYSYYHLPLFPVVPSAVPKLESLFLYEGTYRIQE